MRTGADRLRYAVQRKNLARRSDAHRLGWHAVHDGRAFILRNRVRARLTEREQAGGAVVSHTGENDADYTPAAYLRG
jgi:hypothetical protein